MNRMRLKDVYPSCHWVRFRDSCMLSELLARIRLEFRNETLALKIERTLCDARSAPSLALSDLQSADGYVLQETVLTSMVGRIPQG